MQNLRRIKRMNRGRKRKAAGMNLVSLMDVFTILVFFLLVNSATTEELPNPKVLKLPDSVAERKPEQTIVVMVTKDDILVNNEIVARIDEIMDQDRAVIEAVKNAMREEAGRIVVQSETAEARRRAVTIMGDREIPFRLLKRVMASCTAAGYDRISLAVVQKASQTP